MNIAQQQSSPLLLPFARFFYMLCISLVNYVSRNVNPARNVPSSSRSFQLPIEVCERVIDFVNASFVGFNHETDKYRRATLLACALTCRSWRPRSQLHLYRFVILDDRLQLYSWMDSLLHNPELGTYIRDLAIRGNRTSASFPSGTEQWTSLLSLTLRHLPCFERLTLKWCDWRCLHRSFFVMTSCIPSVTSLTLSSVRLHASKELVHFICSFPNLVELTLHGVQCTNTGPFPLTKRMKQRADLHELSIHGPSCASAGAVLRILHLSSSGSRLRSLKVAARHKPTQLGLNYFLSGCSALEELDLFFDMEQLKPETQDYVDLSACPNLQHLQIKFSQIPTSSRSFLPQTLSTIPSTARVQTIKISLLEERKDAELLDHIDWDALDSSLDAPKFRTICRVTVWICIWAAISVDFVEKHLPRLHKRKLLVSELRLQ